jgi:hypothetical protein
MWALFSLLKDKAPAYSTNYDTHGGFSVRGTTVWLPAQWLRNQQHVIFLTAFYLNFTYLFILIRSAEETTAAVLIPF